MLHQRRSTTTPSLDRLSHNTKYQNNTVECVNEEIIPSRIREYMCVSLRICNSRLKI